MLSAPILSRTGMVIPFPLSILVLLIQLIIGRSRKSFSLVKTHGSGLPARIILESWILILLQEHHEKIVNVGFLKHGFAWFDKDCLIKARDTRLRPSRAFL